LNESHLIPKKIENEKREEKAARDKNISNKIEQQFSQLF